MIPDINKPEFSDILTHTNTSGHFFLHHCSGRFISFWMYWNKNVENYCFPKNKAPFHENEAIEKNENEP